MSENKFKVFDFRKGKWKYFETIEDAQEFSEKTKETYPQLGTIISIRSGS